MRKRVRRRRMPSKKAKLWMKNLRGFPNQVVSSRKIRTQFYNLPSQPVASLAGIPCTGIPSGVTSASRERNNIFIKGFSYDFRVRAGALNSMPTFMRIACVIVPSGVAGSVDLFRNPNTLEDNSLDLGTANSGYINLVSPLNPNVARVIWSTTKRIGPLLEAGATTIQSNLNAQATVSGYVKFNKKVLYDNDAASVLAADNVFFYVWFDDEFRTAGATSTATFQFVSTTRTYFVDT